MHTPYQDVDMHTFIHGFFLSFPRFFAEKRYKLSNFAPKLEIVENYHTCLIFNKKGLTAGVNNYILQWNN